jgi:hypothetical protein
MVQFHLFLQDGWQVTSLKIPAIGGPGLLGVVICLASRTSVGFDAQELHKNKFGSFVKTIYFYIMITNNHTTNQPNPQDCGRARYMDADGR